VALKFPGLADTGEPTKTNEISDLDEKWTMQFCKSITPKHQEMSLNSTFKNITLFKDRISNNRVVKVVRAEKLLEKKNDLEDVFPDSSKQKSTKSHCSYHIKQGQCLCEGGEPPKSIMLGMNEFLIIQWHL